MLKFLYLYSNEKNTCFNNHTLQYLIVILCVVPEGQPYFNT